MKGLLLTEFLVAEGILIYKGFKQNGRPPLPGQLLAASGVFVLLGIVAEFGPGASQLASMFGAGVDIAAAFNIFQKIGTNTTQPKAVTL